VGPLELGFKSVIRNFYKDFTANLVEKYRSFIKDIVPDSIVDESIKELYLNYLSDNWYDSPWVNTFSAEILYQAPPSARLNPLMLTNHISE
jgi:hypothetical protein